MTFTVLHIKIMLHHYAIAAPYSRHDPAHANSEAVREYHAQLISRDMLRQNENSPSGYSVTLKGLSYVNALKAVAEPICCRWRQP